MAFRLAYARGRDVMNLEIKLNEVVIRAEGLGKKYVIGHERERERYALRDVIARSARNALAQRARHGARPPIVIGDRIEEFWALKDVELRGQARRGASASSAATAPARPRC